MRHRYEYSTLRAKQFDLACHHVEIDEYDEVVSHCINKTLIFIMMHYGLNINQTRYKYFIKHIKRY